MKKVIGKRLKKLSIKALFLGGITGSFWICPKCVMAEDFFQPVLTLEGDASWTDEENYKAEITMKISGLSSLKEAQETGEIKTNPEIQEEFTENTEEPALSDIPVKEYFLVNYISEYFKPEENALPQGCITESLPVTGQNGEETVITKIWYPVLLDEIQDDTVNLVYPVILREEYSNPSQDKIYPVSQDEPLQKDQWGTGIYVMEKTADTWDTLADCSSPVLTVCADLEENNEEAYVDSEISDMSEPYVQGEMSQNETYDQSEIPQGEPPVQTWTSEENTQREEPDVVSPQTATQGNITWYVPTVTPAPWNGYSQEQEAKTVGNSSYKTSSKPRTGDEAETGLFIILSIASVISVGSASIYRKGKNQR